ncbi:AAA family ATPase [Blastococcus mobilis]|uniref:AAA domain-containing protein n=1 Tax=Blastococcus mobilis TaxID=1938746 RepID=A0A238VX35_9ACTN|nr:AAA family ATPase [Blastococcus mobilis]SNR38856.1 AAA domain-containing protein [Blastococcus mobilis]
MALRTRKPTGLVPYPFILLEGCEGSGKTYAELSLSSSKRIGRFFHFDLGEGSADEYMTLGDFEVVEHNGTYGDILGQLREVHALPHDPAAPNVIGIDSMTALWAMLCEEAQQIADRRKNKSAGEADITMDLWNKAKGKWRAVVDLLMTYPGIVVVTARGKEVAEVVGGKPTPNKIWKVEAEKSLGFDVNVWVRFTAPRTPVLVKARSLRPEMQVPEGRTRPLGAAFNLDALIFDAMGCGAGNTGARVLPSLSADEVTVAEGKAAMASALGLAAGLPADLTARLKTIAGELWTGAGFSNDQEATIARGKLDELLKAAAVAGQDARKPVAPVKAADPFDPLADVSYDDANAEAA